MRKIYFLLLLCCLSTVVKAQTISAAKYPFTTTTGATLENLSTGATTIHSAGADDNASGVINIGFDFWYIGTRYTQFSVSSNGLVRLGATAGTGTLTNSLATTTNNPKITAFWDDLYSASGGVRYKVIGTAPNRKLVIDFYNYGVCCVTTGTMNFQVWLFESTGVIECVYGAGMTTSSSYSVGLANGTTVYAAVTTSSHTCSYTTVNNANTVSIASGRKYTFTPIIPAAPTSINFTSVTGTAMTVNWTAASPTTNIYGYALYRSTDGGATYTFVNTYAGATTTTAGSQTGLTAGVTYTWKVVAYTEGGLSSPLVGSQTTTATACTGTPTAGTVAASVSSGCSAYSTVLSLTGATTGVTGLNYQWQSSADNSSWTSITGATNSTYTTTISTSAYYRCIVGCTPSGLNATTSGMFLGLSTCYTMSFNTTVSSTTCGGLFYDDGGPSGDYNASNGTSVYTFYPGATGTGSKVGVHFNSFASESCCDYMYIYNGNSTGAAVLGGPYYNTVPPDFTSTAADGSLTFMFYSDGSVTAAGFAAQITTTTVNPITSHPTATTSTCIGYSPVLTVGVNGTNTYQWFNNGTTNSNTGGSAISGATNASYSPSTAATGLTYYYCRVTTGCGVQFVSNTAGVTVNASPSAITGTLTACSGNSTTLSSATGGGAWSTSSGIASVTSGGVVTAGGTSGTTTVSYTVSGCSATATYTVIAAPGTNAGTHVVCSGLTTTLTNPGGLGTWSSSNTGVATVGSSSGIVTGVAGGTAVVSYSNGCGSPVGSVVTVNQTPGAITGATTACIGGNTTLSNPNTGGTWSSSNTAVATVVSGTGVVTGVSGGTCIITYNLGNGCAVATRVQTINIAPPSISITPSTSSTICLTSSGTFTATTTPTVNVLAQDWNTGMTGSIGGTWNITNTAGVSTSYWQIRTSPGYAGETGDGTPMMEAAPDATTGLTSTIVTSPAFSLAGYSSASLSLNQYYLSYSADATVAVEYSTNGGSSWTTLSSILGTTTGSTTWTAGTPTTTLSLAALIGQPNVMLRWNYISTWGFYWAIDNIVVTANYNTPTYAWTGISGATGLSCSACAATTITPTALGANVYSITATANGCTTTSGVTVTTEQAGAVTVTGGGTACGAATLNATGGTGGTIYYQGTTSGGTSTATPSSTQSVTTSGTYYFRARTATAACWGTQGSATVTINAVPAAAPTNSGPICNGGTVTLAANPSGGASVFTWSGPNLAATTGATPTATPTVTSVYSLTVSDGSGNPGCSPATVYTTQVTVNATPTAAPTNSGPICNGGTVTLTANPAGGASVFTWSGPNLAATTGATPTATPTVTSVYSLTVSDGTAVSGCSPSTIYTTSVTVRSTPIAAPTNNGHICVGGTVNLTANGSGGASVYTWSGASISSTTAANPTAAPASTSVYSLTVSDGSGDSGCSPATVYTTSVTVNAVPTAAPTNSSPICNGGTVTLTANPANGASAYSWSGSSLSASTTENPTAIPTVTSTYSLTVSDGSGHSGCSPSTVYTTSVTVNATPTAAPTNSGPICNGGTVTLTANPAGGATTYTWSGPSLSSATVANPTATPTVTSVYSLTVSDGTAASGCSPATVYTTQVTVRPTPTAAPTNNGYICNGGTVTLTANGANGASVYNWSGSALVATTGATPTATPTVTSVYSVTVTDGTSDNGCSPSTVYTTSVTVNGKPVASPTNSSPICNGGTVTLTANPSGGATTYNWSGASLASATLQNPTATPTVTSVYSLTVTDGSSQPGCSPSTVYTTSVTVNSTPIAAPTNDGYICNGGTVNLSANGSGGASVYSWSGPSLSSSTIANPTATPTVTSVYSLTVTDGSGFAGCSPSTVYTTSVTVNSKPTATPTNNGYICNGGTVTLTANGANGASVYNWTGSSLIASTGATTTATPTVTGVYSLTVTDGSTKSGCSPSTIYTTSVTVNAKPTATVANNGYICNGGTVMLTATPAGGASTYAWSGASLVASTGVTTTATPTVTSVYSLTVTDGSSQPGCSPSTIYTTSVTVNAKPTATVANNGYICNGGTVTITATPAGGASTYAWSGAALVASTGITTTATPTVTSVYSLTVTDGSTQPGCSPSAIYTTSVTVNNTPTAAPTNSGVICVSGTVTLNANPANGASTYAWSGSSLVSSTLQNTTATPTVTTTYSLTVTDGSGKPGCSPATVYTTTVTVNPAPSLTSATNNGPICQPATLLLSANGAANVTGYSWAGPVAITGATTATPSVPGTTTAATGIYSVTVNNASGSGCTRVYTTSATVNTIPTVASITPSTTNMCNGTALTLTAGSVSGSGSLTSYNWSGPNSYTSTTATNTAVLTPTTTAASGVYTLSVTYTGSGCTSSPVTSSAVTVNNIPTMTSIGVSPTVLCAGAVLSLTGNGASGTGSLLSYNWSGPGSYSSTTSGSTQVYTTPNSGASGSYSVTVTYTGTGCTSNPVASSNVTVNPLPLVVNVNGGGFYCSGGTGVTIGLDSSETGINYQLYLGSTAVGTPVSGTGIAISFGYQTAAGTYTVSATNATTLCSNNMAGSTTVTVGSVPVVYSVTGGGGYCSGGTGVSVGMSNSQSSVSYQLRRGGVDVGSVVSGTGSAFSFGLFTTPGNYTVIANPSASCAQSMSGSATVFINPLPTVYNVSGGGAYCAGGTGFHIVQDFSVVGINYQLYNGATPVGSPVAGASSGLDFGLLTAAGTYSVLATNTSTSCQSAMSGTPTIVVNPLPAAFAVTGGGNYCSGGAGVSIGLAGSATGINYQVYNGGSAVGSPVSGTGSALSLGTFTAAGTYTVLATNVTTSCTQNMTGSATVVINALPTIYSMTGGGSYCTGGSGVHVGLVNSQTGVNYQLYSGATAIGSPVAGAGSALDFGLITTAGTYTVKATNATTSCVSNMSGTAVVSINALPAVQTVTGGGTLCSGAAGVSIGLNSSETGINYQLYNGATATGSPLAGTGSSISFGAQTVAGTYTVFATNATTSCVRNMTGSATVVVNPLPTTFNVTGGGSYCSGGTGIAIGLSGSQSGINYQLYNGASTVGGVVSGTGAAVSFGVQTASGTYTVLATNATTSCNLAMTGSAAIVINALPVAYSVTGGGTYCSGGSGVNVGLGNSETGINYQLYRGATAVGSVVAGTGSSIDFGLQTTAGTYSVLATNATTSCTRNMTGSVTVSINAVPAAQTVTGGGNYCSGGSGVLVGLGGSATGVNYQLYRGATSVGSPLAGTGSALSFGLQTTAGTYTVLATNTANGCTANMTGSAVVVIYTIPSAYSVTGGGNYCAGSTGLAVGLVSSNTGVNYQLYNGSTVMGSVVAGTGSAISFGVQTMAGTYTVVATDATNGCTSPMVGSASIVINPLPSAYTVTGGGNYCSGGTGVHIGLSFTNSGVDYQLYNGATAVGSPVAGTSTSIDFGLLTTAGTYTVFATNATTSCTNAMSGSATVVIDPLPAVYAVTGGGSYCDGGTGVAVGLAGSETGINYQLYNGTIATGSAVAGTGAAISFGSQTAAGTYTVFATNTTTSCVNNMTGSATVVVNPLPTQFAMTGGGTMCVGDAGYHVGLSGSETGINYQLYNGLTTVGSVVAGTGGALDFGVFTTAGTYSVGAVNTTTSCTNNMSGVAVVIVNPLPAIQNMTGGGAYCVGGTGVPVGLTGSVSGINYQLYRGATVVGSPFAGTGSVISFGLQTTAGSYSVLATNATTGCMSNMSGISTVVVNSLPVVYTVTGGGSYCAGTGGVYVGMSGSDFGVNYQLYKGSVAYGSPLPGTGTVLTFGLLDVAGTYTVFASNPSTTCINNMSGSATVVVNPLPAQYTLSGGGSYCNGSGGVSLSLSGSEAGITYQIYNGSSLYATYGGTGSAMTFSSVTPSGSYSILATNPATSCTRVMTGTPSVTILPVPQTYTVTGGGIYCLGGIGVNIGLSGSNTAINYQLYNGTTAMGTPFAGPGTTFSFGLQTLTGTYSVLATNILNGCTSPMAGTASIATNPLPVQQTVSGGGAYCAGGTGVAVNLLSSQAGINYQLYNGTAAIGTTVSGTGSAISFGLQTTPGTYTVVATNTTTGCTNAMLGAATISINPLPSVYTVTGGGNYCSGGSGLGVALSGSATGINYQLYNGSTPTGAAISGTGLSFNFGLQTAAGSYSVRATNIATGCVSNMTGTASIIVNPLPTAYTVTGGGNYCVGGTGVAVGLSGSNSGITYALLNGSSTVATATGTGSALSFGNQSTVATYTVLATAAGTGCTRAMSGNATVGVNPLPVSQIVSGGGSYCVGSTGVNVNLLSSEIGVNYQLYSGSTAIGASVAGTGAPANMALVTAAGTYSVSATNATTGCSNGMTGVAVVNVNALPTAYAVTGGGNYCAGGTGVAVGLAGSEVGVSYMLYNGAGVSGSIVAGTGSAISFGTRSLVGTYTVLATNATTTCMSNMSGSAVININASPAAYNVTGGGTYCAGGSGFVLGLAGSAPGISYQLYNGSAAVGSSVAGTGFSISFGTQYNAGIYTVLATNNSTACTSNMTGAATISVNAQPTVYNMTGGGAYCAGGAGVPVGLSGSTSGINYQLYYGGTVTGSPVAGTGSALDLGFKTNAGSYSIIATNSLTGCIANMSGTSVVAVNAVPVVQTVIGGGNYCAGGAGVFVVLGGSQTGISYQLYNGATASGSAMSGTGSAVSFGAQTAAGIYSVLATDPATSCTSSMTGTATVIVNALPAAFAVTGGGNYCAGTSGVSITLSGSAVGVSYQLYNGTTSVGTPIAGTGTVLNFGMLTTAGTYSVLATNTTTGCTAAMTGAATVAVNAQPVVYTVTGGGSYCAGSAGVNIGLSGSNTGINYQLYNGSATSGAVVTGTGAEIDFGIITAAGSYSVRAVNASTTCAAGMDESVDVIVNALPVIYAVTGGGSYCTGTSGVVIGLSGSQAGVNYQLYNGTVASGSAVSGTGSAISFGAQTNAGSYNVVATNALNACNANMSGIATVAINAQPTVYNLSGGGAYCAGGTSAPIILDGSSTGVSYRLYNGATAIGSPIAGTGTSLNFGTYSVTGNYSVLATNVVTSCAEAMNGSVAISVSPLPVAYAVNGGGTYCTGGTGVTVGLNNSQAGITYQLYNGTVASGLPVAGTGSAISFGAQTTAGNYTVVAENAITHCVSNMTGSATINISSLPAVYNMTGGGAYCAGGSGVAIGINGSQTGVTYRLYNGTTAVGAAISGTGSALSFGIKTATGNYTVIASDATYGCTSNMTGVSTIVVNPLPADHSVTGGGNYCSGGTGISIGLDGSDAGVVYTMYNGTVAAGTPISGTGSAVTFGNQTDAGSYTVVAADAVTGCSSNMSGTATIIVNTLPSVFNVTASATSYCAGGAGINISLSGSATGITYQLYNGSVPSGAPVAGTGAAISFGLRTVAGNYTAVAINTATSCTRNMSGSASISINPLPEQYNVSGGGAACAGTAGVAVSISGSETGINYRLYNGSTLTGTPLAGTGSLLNFGPQNIAGTYSVMAVDPSTGCTKAMAGNAVVTINNLPATFTVTGGGNFCSGTTGVHVGLSGSASAISYQLYKDGSATGIPVTGAGSTIDFGLQTMGGNYAVVATDPVTSCTRNMTGTVTVSVNALPVTYSVTGGGAYCNGGAGVNVGVSASQSGVTYRLYRGATLVSSVSGSTGAVSFGPQTIAGVYSVSAINTATGCQAAMTGSATVSVNSLPAVYNVTGGGSYCEGGAGIAVGVASSEAGVQYRLYLGAAAIGSPVTGTGGSVTFGAQNVAGVYTVMATNAASCMRPMSSSAVVSITPAVVPSVTLSLSTDNTVCSGTSVTYTATSVNGGSTPAYQWYINASPVGSGASSYSYAPANGDVVEVSMTSSAACPAVATVSQSATMTVNPTQTPVVNVSRDFAGAICKGSSVTFTATPVYGGTAPIYSWLKNGVFQGAGATYSVAPDDSDIIYCMMTSNFTCRTVSTVTSIRDTMDVVTPQTPTVIITSDAGTTIVPGQSVTFTATIANAGPTPGVQWLINGEEVSGATTASFITNLLQNHDTVTCRILSSGTCGGQYSFNSIVIEVGNVGVVSVPVKDMDVRVLPNPNKGDFTLKGTLGADVTEVVTIDVTNMLGQVVFSGKTKAIHGVINEKIIVDNMLSNGVYLLNLRSGDRSKVLPVTISR
jgi:hypothetical protein